MRTLHGEVIGEVECGYGRRFLVKVDRVPGFRNNGYNHFAAVGVSSVVIKGLRCDHESFAGHNPEMGFLGWVHMVDDVSGETPVFVSPSYEVGGEYRISG